MLFRSLLTGIILTAGAFAQTTSFPKPNYFRETFSKEQPKVELLPPAKLKDYVVGDKLELSMKNYLELVMANNTDVQLQRLSLEIPKNAIQRAFGAWDPRATAQFSNTRSTSPPGTVVDAAGNPVVSGNFKSLSQPLTLQVNQTLQNGGSYVAVVSGGKTSNNNSFNNFNPGVTSSMSISYTQPLLQNRGRYVNRLTLMINRSSLRLSEYNLKLAVINLVSAAENAYWDVIRARESLRVAESAEITANQFFDLQRKQLDLGALSPLDIYASQQQAAQRKVETVQARFNLALVEDILRKQIGADLDPEVRKLPIVLTETVEVPAASLTVDRDAAIEKALANRPDLKGATQNLDIDDLRIQQSRNALLPNLALISNFTANGRSGVLLSQNRVTGAVAVIPGLSGGLVDSFDQMFGFGFNSYQMGLRLTFPLKSRQASADMADAVVRKRQDTLTLRNTQQTIRLNMLNALTSMESSKESVELAKVALDFANKNLDAANKKYELGTGLQLDVQNAQNAKVQAESQVVTNQIQLRKNLINLLVQQGVLLDERGIIIQ